MTLKKESSNTTCIRKLSFGRNRSCTFDPREPSCLLYIDESYSQDEFDASFSAEDLLGRSPVVGSSEVCDDRRWCQSEGCQDKTDLPPRVPSNDRSLSPYSVPSMKQKEITSRWEEVSGSECPPPMLPHQPSRDSFLKARKHLPKRSCTDWLAAQSRT